MKRKIYREDILQAGKDLMFEHGYNATGIKDITDRIAIPKGSFYNHFSSKEEFGLEMVENYCKNGVKFYKRDLIEADGTPAERLYNFFDKMIEGYRGEMEGKLGCIMSNFSAEMGDVNENFRQVLDKYFDECEDVLVECLDQAKEAGEIDANMDTRMGGAILLNSWHGAFIRMKSIGTVKPMEDFRDFILKKIIL